MMATMPTTVISPNVSKPRKSTSMTFTTLRPPACSSALLRKKGASSPVEGRVSTAKASAATTEAREPRRPSDRGRGATRARSVLRRGSSHVQPFGQPSQVPAGSARA